jgi:hypothetical protein
VAQAIMKDKGTSTRGVPFLFEGLLVKYRETILTAQKRFATVLTLAALRPHGSTGSP